MDKNYWLALVLSMAILMGYPYLLEKLNLVPKKTTAETTQETASQPARQIESAADEAVKEVLSQPEGPFIEKAAPPAIIQYQNSLFNLKFSTLGATVTEMVFKGEGTKKDLDETSLFMGEDSSAGIFGVNVLHETADLSQTAFRLSRSDEARGIFEFVYEKPAEFRFTKTFSVSAESPVILLDLKIENISSRERHLPLEFDYGIRYDDAAPEHLVDVESVVYQEKIRSAKADKIAKKGFFSSGQVEWAGVIKKYFAVLAKPEWKIISNENRADGKTLRGLMRLEPLTVPASGAVQKQIFIYAGPQRYETLKPLGFNFEDILSKGFFGLFKIWLLIGLKFFNQYTHNFGWSIILMTLVLKGVFTPLTHISYESMRKMQALQPKLKSLQERYKKDPAKLNREMMELYRRNKVNPMGGCLPMLAQIPVFIAFYQVLNETIELRGTPFAFWIHDLAQPDRLFMFPFTIPFIGDAFNLLPLLMIGSMVWQQQLTPQAGVSKEQAQIMQWMPIVFGFFFYNMPSGLVLYWFVNNMLTIFHQIVIKRMGAVVLHHEDRE
jgi:YidC/Oxa1 family membrane protein insertase